MLIGVEGPLGLKATAATLSRGESTLPLAPGLGGRLMVFTVLLDGCCIEAPRKEDFGGDPMASPGGPRGAKANDEEEAGLDKAQGLLAVKVALLDRLRCHRLGDAFGLPLPMLIF